jgi:pterin-4a-carbinolamine dehydratase
MSTTSSQPRKKPAPAPPAPPRVDDKLKAERVELMLKTIPGWSLTKDGSAIVCQYTFLSNSQAYLFTKRVCSIAARRHHYPAEIRLQNGEVTLLLSSTVEGLSQADFLFAKDINRKA